MAFGTRSRRSLSNGFSPVMVEGEQIEKPAMTHSPVSQITAHPVTIPQDDPAPRAVISHQQIADRARAIWQRKGCPSGRDEENWREAETQLREELDV